MRVAVDILPGVGAGVGRWQRETVRALAAAVGGALTAVTAFAFGMREPRPEWMPRSAGFSVNWLPGRGQELATWLGLPVERVCRLGRTDVVLNMNMRPVRSRAAVVQAIPDVSWRTFSGQYRTTFNDGQIRRAEAAIRRADHLLTISRASADGLVRGGVPAERITVAPLGVSEEFRNIPAAEADRVRGLYRLPERFVLCVGGINERKNLPVLIGALDHLPSPPPLILAGPPPAEPPAFWGLDRPWARHLGYIPGADVPGLYAAATVKVLPSKLEGFGLPLVEAMAAGTPVLAADTPVFREVGGDAVRYFPPDDADALAGLLRTAFDSRAFREEYRVRGLARAAGWTWARYGDRLLDAIRAAARLKSQG